jgi:hypothetical protein
VHFKRQPFLEKYRTQKTNGYLNMLILDFDGVLINSLDEVALTAYNATTGKLVTSLADLPTALVGLFQRNRYHVQSIGDGILLMEWCLNYYRIEPSGFMKLAGDLSPKTLNAGWGFITPINRCGIS